MRYIPVERQPDSTPPSLLLRDDTKFAAAKIAAFQYFAVAVFLYLAVGYWDLQVRNEEFYSEKAQQNQIKSLPIPAARGKILDRDGRVIVDNHSTFSLILSRENLTLQHLRAISDGLSLDYDEMRARLKRFDRTRPKYEPIILKEGLTPGETSNL